MNLSRLYQALVLPLMIAATAAPAQTLKPVRIGVMTDMVGMTVDIVGPGSVIATKTAAEDFGGKLGARSIEMLTAGHVDPLHTLRCLEPDHVNFADVGPPPYKPTCTAR